MNDRKFAKLIGTDDGGEAAGGWGAGHDGVIISRRWANNWLKYACSECGTAKIGSAKIVIIADDRSALTSNRGIASVDSACVAVIADYRSALTSKRGTASVEGACIAVIAD